jgi:glutathione S-transferase
MTIKLYQFPPALGLPNASPFCMKLETYLRMTGLPFQSVYTLDLRRAPKRKMPYIDDQGTVVADSNLAIDYLKSKYGDPLDGWLSTEQRAVSLAMRRLIEEDLYWALLHERWMDEAGWAMTRDAFFARVPAPLKWVLPNLARRSVRESLWGHGMGRHSHAEIDAIGCADLTALADFLDAKAFMMGSQPSTLDATAYATFANILWVPHETVFKAHLARYPQVAAYCERMKARYYA